MSVLSWSEVTDANGLDIASARDTWNSAIDPYLVWAYVTNFEHVIKPQIDEDNPCSSFIPIVIELNGTSVSDFVEFADEHGVSNFLSISHLYRNAPVALEDVRFLTAEAKVPEFFDSLNPGGQLFDKIKRFELGLAIEPSSMFGAYRLLTTTPTLAADVPMSELDVNLAVIDDGIGFVNNTVLAKDGSSRLKYFWNQDGISAEAIEKLSEFKSRNAVTTPLVSDFQNYGWQVSGNEIEQWIAKIGQNITTEAAIYSAYEYYAVGQSVSHGTHILDAAAGFDSEVDASVSRAYQSRLDATNIVAVQLGFPTRKFADSSGRWLSYNLLDAVRYSLLRGDQMPDACGNIKPMIFNISMGNLAGPHDGTSMFESALDDILSLRNNYVDVATGRPRENNAIECVLSSGNQRQARSHAKFDVKGGGEESIVWRVLPDDATPSFLELWIPETHIEKTDCENIVLEIEPPSGERHKSGNLTCGKTWVLDKDGDNQCVVVYLPPEKVSTGRNGMILIALPPTNGVLNTNSSAPGEWKVTVKNKGTKQLSMSAWIQRDESTFDRPIRGRQSRFVDENHKRNDKFGYPKKDDSDNESYIRIEGTTSAISTGIKSETIGAYRYSDGDDMDYSGLGGDEIKAAEPLAVADDSVTCRGIVGAGTFSGSRVALDGTSVAAAQATRSLVLQGLMTTDPKVESTPAEVLYKDRRIGRKKTSDIRRKLF